MGHEARSHASGIETEQKLTTSLSMDSKRVLEL